jgi:hypothetical protein
MLLLLLSNQTPLTPPINPQWMVCEQGFVNLLECVSGEVAISENENGTVVIIQEENGWI